MQENEKEGENDDDIEKVYDIHFLIVYVVDEIQMIIGNLNEFQSFSKDLFSCSVLFKHHSQEEE